MYILLVYRKGVAVITTSEIFGRNENFGRNNLGNK